MQCSEPGVDVGLGSLKSVSTTGVVSVLEDTLKVF